MSLVDKHVVIVFELNAPSESLSPTEQVNEVFGPFDDGDAAQEWAARAAPLYGGARHWLIIPVSDPSVLNRLDPLVG